MSAVRAVVFALAATSAAASIGAGRTDAQPPATRPRITGISHVVFRVTDAASARSFYGGVLGLTMRDGSSGVRVTYRVGDRQHITIEPGLPAGEDERLSHLAFETNDIRALRAYFTSRGVEPQTADSCQPGAIRVTDPDGHPIEFVPSAWPPLPPGAPAPRALSRRILHAGLTIRDEQAAHKFYRDVLGFSEIWRGGRQEGVTRWVNMRVPDGTEYLEYMLETAAPDRRARGVLHHVALVVPDIQAAWEEAIRRTPEAARATMPPPNVGVNGRWQLNLFDPDGTRAELMEPFRVR